MTELKLKYFVIKLENQFDIATIKRSLNKLKPYKTISGKELAKILIEAEERCNNKIIRAYCINCGANVTIKLAEYSNYQEEDIEPSCPVCFATMEVEQ